MAETFASPAHPLGTAGPDPGRRSRLRPDLALLALGTAILRIPALLASAHLTVDDGVFGASAVVMRAGALPFRDVFSSQGPLFLPLVWSSDLVGLRTLNSPRVLALVSGIALVLAVYAGGRIVADRQGALLAAGVTSITGSVLWVTGPLAADGPALALATGAVVLALRYRRSPTTATALAIGLCVGAALSVKSLVLPLGLPVGLALLAGRRLRHLILAGGAAVAVGLAVSLPWGLADVWDQSVTYHLEAADDRTPLANLGKVASTLGDRDLPVVALAALALGALVLARRRASLTSSSPVAFPRPWPPSDALLLGGWLVATLAILATEYPLWRPHVAYLVPATALLVALRPPPLRALLLAALLVVPYHVVHLWPVFHPDPYDAAERAVQAELRALPGGARAISDEPGLVWRAGRRTPPDLVDASRLRIDSGRITAESLGAAAADPQVCALAVWSTRFGDLDRLPAELEAAGYTRTASFGGSRSLWQKHVCDPT